MNSLCFGPITQEWVKRYSLVSGDDNPLHIRPEGQTIVHGALIAALIERFLVHTLLGARVLSIRYRFVAPVPVDSSLVVKLTAQRQIVENGLSITDQKAVATLLSGRPAVLAECRHLPAS